MSSTAPTAGTASVGRPAHRRRSPHTAAAWGFLGPFVVLFATFLVAPIAVALVTSLQSRQLSGIGFDGAGPRTVFVGLDNYATALGDSAFIAGFGRVLLFGAVQVPVMLALALLLALVVDAKVSRSRRFLQLSAFLPFAIPTVVAALLWGFLYQPGVSPLVGGLQALGLDVDLLGEGTVLWSIANVTTWSTTGINMIIIFAALQAIPRELFEAARVDGAGEIRTALQVKVPIVMPAVVLTLLFSVIGTIQLFNEPLVLRNLTTNVTSDYTPNIAVFLTTQQGEGANLGSAMAVVVAVVTMTLSVVVAVVSSRRRSAP